MAGGMFRASTFDYGTARFRNSGYHPCSLFPLPPSFFSFFGSCVGYLGLGSSRHDVKLKTGAGIKAVSLTYQIYACLRSELFVQNDWGDFTRIAMPSDITPKETTAEDEINLDLLKTSLRARVCGASPPHKRLATSRNPCSLYRSVFLCGKKGLHRMCATAGGRASKFGIQNFCLAKRKDSSRWTRF